MQKLIDMRSLDNDVYLADNVKNILSMDERQAKRIVGGTTITAYRRIHEVVGAVLDRMHSGSVDVASILVDLSRCLVLIRYQAARDQISRNLADSLVELINGLMNKIKSNPGEIKRLASRARTLIDAIAVLVYQVGRR